MLDLKGKSKHTQLLLISIPFYSRPLFIISKRNVERWSKTFSLGDYACAQIENTIMRQINWPNKNGVKSDI